MSIAAPLPHTNRKWSFIVQRRSREKCRAVVSPSPVGDDCRLAMCEVPFEHPFMQVEQLMPVIPVCRVKNTEEAITLALKVEHGYAHSASMYSTNIDHLSAMARVCNASIFVKNHWNVAGLAYEGEGYTSFTIASPTGEGLTTARHFSRERRCTMKDHFRFV